LPWQTRRVPTAVRHLYWCDVDPARHLFDPAPARIIAEKHILWAVDGVRRRKAPLGGRAREDIESSIDRDLIAHYGAWAAGWRWAASEPGCGGPVRGWCCASHSLLRKDDADADASIGRVVDALSEWRAFLAELAERFARHREADAALGIDQRVEHAAAALLPLVLERTRSEDAWYATYYQVLSWYLESTGLDPDRVRGPVRRVVSGRFRSWCEPEPDVAAATFTALAREVALAAAATAPDAPVDALAAWLSIRERFGSLPPASRVGPVPRDGHLAFIEGRERERDPERARRMAAALRKCRRSARRGEPLTFDRLAAWQSLVLHERAIGFRTTDAFGKGGRELYPIAIDTRARFDAALQDANDAAVPPSLRAARVYLDVCFFHPFRDGNARAARLALDHVLTRAGLSLYSAEPLFIVARAGTDEHGPFGFQYLVDYLTGPIEG
jgi:hypothetical protein